jgi:hypothetical protein
MLIAGFTNLIQLAQSFSDLAGYLTNTFAEIHAPH